MNGEEMRKKQTDCKMLYKEKVFFTEFYETYKGLLFYFAQKYASNPADVEDLVQDALIRLVRNVSTLQKLNTNKAVKYISLTVKSVYLDNKKVLKPEMFIFCDDEQLGMFKEDQLSETYVEDRITNKMHVDRLRREMHPRDWFVLEAKYLMELSDEEIAGLIGVSSGSIRMMLHRAREKAKMILDADAVGGD